MTDYVYHARFISEDTNPWDSNESYGVWRDLEGAQKYAFADFYILEEGVVTWVESDPTYGGLDASMPTWKRLTHAPDEEPEDDGDGYGMYIFQEELR